MRRLMWCGLLLFGCGSSPTVSLGGDAFVFTTCAEICVKFQQELIDMFGEPATVCSRAEVMAAGTSCKACESALSVKFVKGCP